MSHVKTQFQAYHPNFANLVGTNPELELLLENYEYPFAHEAGVFIVESDELFITSNQIDKNGEKKIQISKVKISRDGGKHVQHEIHPENVHMANGGHRYEDGVIFCSQGHLDKPGGVAFMELKPPYRSELLVSSFHGRPFNSVNDLVVHKDGSIWFTDPIYGSEQGFRPKPSLPNQVYRFDPVTKYIRAVADNFGRPNGLCFSPDQKVLYVTDTDFIHGDGSTDLTRASTIYAFDVLSYSGEPFLCNRRLFAMATVGIPDGIKCDRSGNVYSGCGDGLNIWNSGGVLLGKILVEGGVANFCFGRDGEIYLLNEHKLWRAHVHADTGSCINIKSNRSSKI